MNYEILRREFDKALNEGDKDSLAELHEDIEEFWFDLRKRSDSEVIFRDELTRANTLYDESCHHQMKKT